MANLNLSEFTEKLFVADADHTFIWDTANAISKRVSRNSWLNSGELTSSAPVTISQTWATTGIYTAFKVVANETAVANTLSNVFELWSGNAATLKLSIRKSGQIVGPSGTIAAPTYGFADTDWGTGFSGWYRLGTGVACSTAGGTISAFSITHTNIRIGSSIPFGWTSGTAENALDTILLRDGAANTLALRNGALAQTFNVYGTWTTAITNFERLAIKYNTTDVAYQIAAEKGTTNGDYRPLQLWTGGASRLHITTAGNVGIGTTAPGSTLTVAGTFHFGSNNGALIGGTSYGGHLGSTQYFGLRSTSAVSTTIYLQNNSSGDKNAVIRILGSGSGADHGALDINTIESSPILFTTGLSNERMRITAAGNVGIGTTSPTSKLHVVGDAVLTGQLLGSNYTVGTADSVTQANIAITNNHVGFADSAIVITPKGVGAFIVGPKPDGTATGGNARGNYAVDLQISKTANTQIAAGINSVITGGKLNTASGELSFVGGGNTNQAGSYLAAVGAGSGNNSNGYASYVGCGTSNTANGSWAFVGGGTNNVASADMAFVSGGRNASANRYALNAHSAGQFSQVGDAQKTTAVFRNKTTTNSAVELFLDGALQRYTITSGKIISMLINITGTKSDGSAVAHYVRQYSIKNIGGTTSQVYAAVTVGTDNAAGTSIAISADDTNDSLKIEVTGVAAETWRWVASVDAVEVGHGV